MTYSEWKNVTGAFMNKIIQKITRGLHIKWYSINEQNSNILLIFLNKHALNIYSRLGTRLGLRNNKVNRMWSLTSRRPYSHGGNNSFYIQTFYSMT